MSYRRLLILVAIFGLGWGASFAAGLAWSARLLPGQEPAATQPAATQPQRQLTGGAAAGRSAAPAQAANAAAGAAGTAPGGPRQQGAGGAGGRAGFGGGPGGGTFGTVEGLEGDTLTLTTQSGAVKVNLSEQTSIQKRTPGSREPAAGSREDLQNGAQVMVQGVAGEDGTITASSIQVLPAGGFGGAGQRGSGQQGQ